MNTRVAFKIIDFLHLQGGWRPLELTGDIPFTAESLCPADESSLKTLCVFSGQGGRQHMRYGCCDTCGYCTYIDRPTKEWMTRFYANMWKSDESALLTEQEIQNQKNVFFAQRDQKHAANKQFLDLVLGLGVDRMRYVCEIGSGMGDDLRLLRESGFAKLIGTENSRRRAEIAQRVHEIEVISKPFEDETAQSRLLAVSPLSLIFSRHVLEHVYEPLSILQQAARLQKAGDYFIIIVPNGPSEASMTRLLFLPHLHSFSRESLARMLARNNYAITHDLTTQQEIILVGQKKIHPVPTADRTGGHFEHIAHALVDDVRPRPFLPLSRQRMWWEKNFGATRRTIHFPNSTLDDFYFKLLWRLIFGRRAIKFHALLVEKCAPNVSPDAPPLEIRFDGPIALLYK